MNTTIDFILYYIIVVVFINAQKIDRPRCVMFCFYRKEKRQIMKRFPQDLHEYMSDQDA